MQWIPLKDLIFPNLCWVCQAWRAQAFTGKPEGEELSYLAGKEVHQWVKHLLDKCQGMSPSLTMVKSLRGNGPLRSRIAPNEIFLRTISSSSDKGPLNITKDLFLVQLIKRPKPCQIHPPKGLWKRSYSRHTSSTISLKSQTPRTGTVLTVITRILLVIFI